MHALTLDNTLTLQSLHFKKEEKNQQFNDVEIKKFSQNIINKIEDIQKLELDIFLKKNYSALSNLLTNYKKLSAREKEKLMKEIPLDNLSFDFIIYQINKSPDSYKLDLLLSCLCMFDIDKYKRVIIYIKNSKINNYIRSYLIEAIPCWDKIKSEIRKQDLKDAYSKENNKVLQKIILNSINEIE
ncbi:MAG: hypothetical protein JXB50_05575 [Spirochaetes bacterium]|nr:hypothetical protein [Spirochaetota bacterium]